MDKVEGTVNILFISDLHYGLSETDGKFDYDKHRESRKRALDDLLVALEKEYYCTCNRGAKEKIDIVAIGGDLGWHATKKDYEEFEEEFIKPLTMHELVELKNIIVCLGNHDIMRNQVKKDDESDKGCFERPKKNQINIKQKVEGNLAIYEDSSIREKRFNHFQTVTEALSHCGVYPLENTYTFEKEYVESTSRKNRKGIINDGRNASYLYGYRQVVPGVHFLVLNSVWDHWENKGKGEFRIGLDTFLDAKKSWSGANSCGVMEQFYQCPDRRKGKCNQCKKRLLSSTNSNSIVVPTGVTIAMFHHPFYCIQRLRADSTRQHGDFEWLHVSEVSPNPSINNKPYFRNELASTADIIFNGHTHITDETEPMNDLIPNGNKKPHAYMAGAFYSNDTYEIGCWLITLNYVEMKVEDETSPTIRAYKSFSSRKLHYDVRNGAKWKKGEENLGGDKVIINLENSIRKCLIEFMHNVQEITKMLNSMQISLDDLEDISLVELLDLIIGCILERWKQENNINEQEVLNEQKQDNNIEQELISYDYEKPYSFQKKIRKTYRGEKV